MMAAHVSARALLMLSLAFLLFHTGNSWAQDGFIGEKWSTKISSYAAQVEKAYKAADHVPARVSSGDADADKRCRKKWGNNFRSIGFGDVCFRYEGSVFGFAAKEFTDEDIVMEGRRVWTGSSSSPFVFARIQDVSSDTKDIDVGGGLLNDISLVRDTPWGPVLGFIQIGLFSEGDLGSLNSVFDSQNIYNDDGDFNLYPGVFEQAWFRIRGLTVGIQPSVFDFMRPGYAPFPGYATRDTTASISYSYREKNWSLAFAVEDGGRRDMFDGILASYANDFRPDFVTQLRARQKGIVYHASLAIHDIDDNALDPIGLQTDDDFGLAGRIGVEFKWAWMGNRKDPTDDAQMRLMFSVAAAEGAIGYLGVPLFVTDYVAETDGDLSLSRGVSAITSVEYAWATGWSVSATLSGFALHMDGSGFIGPHSMPFDMAMDVDVYGAKLQVGAQKMLDVRTKVGAELAYTWTRAESSINGFELNSVDVGYPELRAFLARRF